MDIFNVIRQGYRHLGRMRWVSKPTAGAVPPGTCFIASDMGDTVWKSSGAMWMPSMGLQPRVLFKDDFKRPNTALGSLGAGWTLTGNGVAQTQVKDGKYILPQTDPVNVRTVYACRNLPFKPTYLAVRFNWKSNGGTSGMRKTVALLLCKTGTLGNVLESVHITLDTQVATQVLSAGGSFIHLVNVFTPPDSAIAPDGTPHLLEVYVFGPLVITQIDGLISGYADAPAHVLPVNPAQQIIVEHYSPSGRDIQYELEVNEILAGLAY